MRSAPVTAGPRGHDITALGRDNDCLSTQQDMGKLDNTLIIYINGDNSTSAEGPLNGTSSELAMFNGVEAPVEDQLEYFGG